MYVKAQCIFCGRDGILRKYYPPDFIETDKYILVPLCQYHFGCYHAHGIKKLDELYRAGKLSRGEVNE